MTKERLINRTVETLEKLPEYKVHEIADFADFVLKKHEERILQEGIQRLANESESFAFLHGEEDLYDESDLREKY